MDIDLKGKSVLITGASKGIGFVIAEHMAAEGCNLHLAARDEDAMRKLAERLTREHGVKITVHRRDLGQKAEVEALGRACADVDILVNDAGDMPPGTLEEIDGATCARPGTSRSTVMSTSPASSIRACARGGAASSSTSSARRRAPPTIATSRARWRTSRSICLPSAWAGRACATACAWSRSIPARPCRAGTCPT